MIELVISGLKKIIFWGLKLLNKKLLRKWFPIKLDKLNVSIEPGTTIYISEKDNYCVWLINLKIENFSKYDLQLSKATLRITINQYNILTFDKLVASNVKYEDTITEYTELHLTVYQAKKILSMLGDGNSLHTHFHYSIKIKSTFGDEIISGDKFYQLPITQIK